MRIKPNKETIVIEDYIISYSLQELKDKRDNAIATIALLNPTNIKQTNVSKFKDGSYRMTIYYEICE